MDWGMKNRMARIIRPDTGRAVMLALDHGYFLGPTHRLEVPRETIIPLLPYADTIMLTRGVLRTSVDPDSGANVVLRVSGGTSIAGPHLEDEGITVDFEEAIRLNVAGVGLSVFVGTEFERQTLLGLSELVNQGEKYGIPVLGITAVGKELEKRDSRYLALCCRICAELGARIVKTYYCEDFEKVTSSCPVPIVIAGGPKLDTEMDVFNMTHEAISRGATGVDMGRNIWQRDNPVAIIRAIRGIVHENMTPKQAHELFTELVENAGVSKRTDNNRVGRKRGKIARIVDYVTPLIEQGEYTREELVSMTKQYFSEISEVPAPATIETQIYRGTFEDARSNKFPRVAVEDSETKIMRFTNKKPV